LLPRHLSDDEILLLDDLVGGQIVNELVVFARQRECILELFNFVFFLLDDLFESELDGLPDFELVVDEVLVLVVRLV